MQYVRFILEATKHVSCIRTLGTTKSFTITISNVFVLVASNMFTNLNFQKLNPQTDIYRRLSLIIVLGK
jgi:hypothetical protein